MNPLDLRGPEFLLFYAALAAAVMLLAWSRRRAGEPEGLPARIDDPYELAALRAGADEAIRAALLSLLDRRLLKATDGFVHALAAPEAVRRPLEKALLRALRTPAPVEDAFRDAEVELRAGELEAGLRRAGLVAERPGAVPAGALLGAAFLFLVAVAKLVVALSRGRTNVGFLIVAGIALPLLTLAAGSRRRVTRKGEKGLELAARAFGRLKRAAPSLVPGGQADELALAFAVFGAGVLPPLARDLLGEAGLKRAAQGGSSCGSSSSCSGGSSCGGGCGGGGCGGCGS